MNITELVTFLYEKTPIQAARKEATDVYIAGRVGKVGSGSHHTFSRL